MPLRILARVPLLRCRVFSGEHVLQQQCDELSRYLNGFHLEFQHLLIRVRAESAEVSDRGHIPGGLRCSRVQ